MARQEPPLLGGGHCRTEGEAWQRKVGSDDGDGDDGDDGNDGNDGNDGTGGHSTQKEPSVKKK